jgi:hypothetical protein
MMAPRRRQGLQVSEARLKRPGSRCSNVIRQPSGPLLGSCVVKKWDRRYKGEFASS